jgi:intracellular sulfur oxidation DsrE/DsrF family protein
MSKKNKQNLYKAIVLFGMLFGANQAFAAEGCQYLPLVPNIIAGLQAGTGPTPNTTVCVDEPVQLMQSHMLFDMDTPVTTDGLPNTTPAGLRHMWMLGIANIARSNAVLNGSKGTTNILPNMHVKGILHGTALSWALNDAWWQAQVDKDGNQLYPNGNPEGPWIQKVLALQAKGLDISIEVCGVTLMGAGLSSDDVYPGIRVNQGAFGRMSALAQEGYTIVSEGWIDTDRRHHTNDKD